MNSRTRTVRFLLRIVILLCFVAAGLASDGGRAAEEDNIREAVFRHQFEHNASGQQRHAHAYCLAIMTGDQHKDPSHRFMTRFSHHKPSVRKASDCHWTEIQVVENRWGRSALIFFVSDITWVSDTEVTVNGGYEEGNVSSSGNTYTVVKEKGKWTVVKDRMNVISSHQPTNDGLST